jgi:hypothetical protein
VQQSTNVLRNPQTRFGESFDEKEQDAEITFGIKDTLRHGESSFGGSSTCGSRLKPDASIRHGGLSATHFDKLSATPFSKGDFSFAFSALSS